MRRTMQICGFSAKDVRSHSTRKYSAKIVTALFFIGGLRQRRIFRSVKISWSGLISNGEYN